MLISVRYKETDQMNYNFFLLTTFLLQSGDNKRHAKVRCLGSREIFKFDEKLPVHIAGMIEFDSSYIPVVDLGAAFGIEPIKISDSACILIMEHNYQCQKFYTGVIIQDSEEIMKLAAGIYEFGTGLGASPNMHFVLEMQNNQDAVYQILTESHRNSASSMIL